MSNAAADESGDEGPDEDIAATPTKVAPPAVARVVPAAPAVAAPVQLASTTFSLQPGAGSVAAVSPSPANIIPAPAATPAPTATTVPPPLVQPAFTSSTPASGASVPLATPPAGATTVAAAPTATPTVAPTGTATVTPTGVPAAEQIASTPPPTTFSTSGPPLVVPPPVGTNGDTVLAAIVANITVPDAELRNAPAAPAGALLTVVEKQADPKARAALAAATLPRERPGAKPTLDAAKLRKDGRGRFIDAQGRPLLDGRGQPMDAKAAISWLTTRDPAYAATLAKADDDAALPKKDARGRFVDARGRPLLDARGRPMTEKAAAAWATAQADTPAKGKADALPKKDARGRFVDAKGKPLLDPRGRPMDAKQAAVWLAAGGKSPADKKDAPEKAEPAADLGAGRGRRQRGHAREGMGAGAGRNPPR